MGYLIDCAIKVFQSEVYSAILYSRLAKLFKDKPLSRKLVKIAEMEARHAAFWRSFLVKRGVNVKEVKKSFINLKVAVYSFIARILGLGIVIKILESSEAEAAATYSRILEDTSVSDEEKKHIRKIIEDELIHEHEFAEEEDKYKDFIEHIRDVVLGMNDGLVEILSVSTGLAGAYGDPFTVALGGAIVGTAGALSMGIGAYTSVKAQKQVRTSVLPRIALAIEYVPKALINKVKKLFERKGFKNKTIDVVISEVSSDKELLGKIIVAEEYGIPEEGIEDPVKSGVYTGLSYIAGAFTPLLPYFIGLPIVFALPLSLVASSLMLAVTGFFIAVTAGLNIKAKILELILAGLGAALLTFLVGRTLSIIFGVEVE